MLKLEGHVSDGELKIEEALWKTFFALYLSSGIWSENQAIQFSMMMRVSFD